MNSHNSLSAASDERKARLAKLKNLKRKQPIDEVATPEGDREASPPEAPDVAKLHLSGRNYDPETRGPKLGFDAPPTLAQEKPTLEEQAAEVEAEVRERAAEEARDDKGLDLFKLQPKKPNWDLKRNLGKKMELLNVRTDNAIAKLVRERVLGAQKAAQKTADAGNGNLDGDAAGVDGIALVEGLRVREQEEQEEEQREREEEEALDFALGAPLWAVLFLALHHARRDDRHAGGRLRLAFDMADQLAVVISIVNLTSFAACRDVARAPGHAGAAEGAKRRLPGHKRAVPGDLYLLAEDSHAKEMGYRVMPNAALVVEVTGFGCSCAHLPTLGCVPVGQEWET
ncbi:uncharacterized protein Triagg1_1861 [Trichoderma aggressivum f. europaeum]|uniref:Cwf18 pre-mRNA splicing factor n=1 Tax=Trichoderma aggressivum f. europaeum TaxID=173218 RepID=A0AAE1IJV8_9HYPO|nr:hypothetical protein Triagg1_1861 [Trichoderma aggressivum f. europaeum]